ncbi:MULTISPECIES: nitroreductase family protein [Syntrophotalea]|jgi:nitroreductase/NAD-dependent dihydropyrimidine dehydrogenase PreA subunit|uniref:Nitroreductase n=1 Tax=Syntrophotalea acetylenica TaxID=29542 RepID=A0A1L3GGE8_SYNAC|nr:nitroreductase family protein [Syntrophotalea acetylenica]APG24939.1 nitroreductase [Syntrophotalea acetylenica]APG43002.1 nitroreductase [Syntrophotalea acetylenica]MDY0261087.1 nitroreductase family protein [Syntrophotalea acetylenica]
MKQFRVDQSLCIQCAECVKDCVFGLIVMQDGYPVLPADKEATCIECQHCLAVCPSGAISILGLDPADSLPLAGRFPNQQQMETLIKGRRSIRRYRPEPLPAETIDELLKIAAHAPTGVNSRGVEFIVVEDPATMDAIRQETMETLQDLARKDAIPDHLVCFRHFVPLMEQGLDPIFRRAPHLLIASAAEGVPTREADVFIALSYFELLANSAGIGTTWLGLAKWAMVDLAPRLLRSVGVPENHDVVYMMLFGTPDVTYYRTVQRDQDAKIRRLVK